MPSVMSRDWNLNFFFVRTLAKEEYLSEFFFRFNGTKFSVLFTNKYHLNKMV
jgi:hypothetical protein